MTLRTAVLVPLLLLAPVVGCSSAGGDDTDPGAAGASGSAMGTSGFPGAKAGAGGAAGKGTAGVAGSSAAGSSAAGSSAAGSSTAGSSAAGSSAAGSSAAGSGAAGSGAAGSSAGGQAGAAGSGTAGSPGKSERRIVGYFPAWAVYARDYHVADIPAAKLTHVNYAFANLSADGECVLGDAYADTDKAYPGDSWDPGAKRGSFHQLELLKQKHPHLRTLISVGGWTWSTYFSDAAATDASRKKLAKSCADFMETWGFDGIDIDWEYPGGGGLDSNHVSPDDGKRFTLLLKALRAEIDQRGDAKGRHYDLTIAAPAGASLIGHLEVAAVGAATDWVNVMSYDYNGGWSDRTAFNAPMFAAPEDTAKDPEVKSSFNVSTSIGLWAQGVPKSKIVMGVPFYGRGFSGVPKSSSGLFQPFSSLPQGSFEAGVFDWKDLAKNHVPKMTRTFHPVAKVPWLWDAASGTMISYDDPESLKVKADFIVAEGLGGAMFWELSGDDAEATLLSVLRGTL